MTQTISLRRLTWCAGVPLLALLTAGVWGGDPPAPLADRGKGTIEAPVKATVRNNTAPTVDAPSNPQVAPGKVHWHPTFEAACAAAQQSHKPVLLFQMMGKLDEQFC
jgi:hypothetical protein